MGGTPVDRLPRLVVTLGVAARDFLREAARAGQTVRVPLDAPPNDDDLHTLEVHTPGHNQPLVVLARPVGPLTPTGYPLRLSLPRTASDPRAMQARSASPTPVLLWRASTRTKLESCIGLSG